MYDFIKKNVTYGAAKKYANGSTARLRTTLKIKNIYFDKELTENRVLLFLLERILCGQDLLIL